jgi:hypothetical protein
VPRQALSIDCVLFRFVPNLERILIAKVLVKYGSREEAAYAIDDSLSALTIAENRQPLSTLG